jgi:hypothetical protein
MSHGMQTLKLTFLKPRIGSKFEKKNIEAIVLENILI